jgi:ABC-type glycerol-3-phosphate transport system permease component
MIYPVLWMFAASLKGPDACVAYAFAKIRFAGRDFWFAVMLLTLMLPGQVLRIPQYIMFSKLDWLDTFKPSSRCSSLAFSAMPFSSF